MGTLIDYGVFIIGWLTSMSASPKRMPDWLHGCVLRERRWQTHDLMIAATALHEGLTVITRDKRSFPLIPNLQVTLV